jgi:hypothetical protein
MEDLAGMGESIEVSTLRADNIRKTLFAAYLPSFKSMSDHVLIVSIY